MLFNFFNGTYFEKPALAPLISVYALDYLKSQRHEFSPIEITAFDALLQNLPQHACLMNTSTRRNDCSPEELYTYDSNDCDGDGEYYKTKKMMVCVCVPAGYSKTPDPVYDLSELTPTSDGLGWNVVGVRPHLDVLSNLCGNYEVTFNAEKVEQVLKLQSAMQNNGASIYEIQIQDYACGQGFVLYNTRSQSYFCSVQHGSVLSSTLLGAEIFAHEEMALKSLPHSNKKDEWIVVPARIHLNGMVQTDNPLLREALDVAQKMRMENQLLRAENEQLREQVGAHTRSRPFKI